MRKRKRQRHSGRVYGGQPDGHKMGNRGYACIGLDNPKSPENVGGVLRAAACYGAAFVACGGERMERLCRLRTDTPKAWKHLPLFSFVPDLKMMLPEGAVPVCVELTDEAESLCEFNHPERGYYIFGPEDGSVREDISQWCERTVMVPTRHCMNLACTVNVVLYDRLSKSG